MPNFEHFSEAEMLNLVEHATFYIKNDMHFWTTREMSSLCLDISEHFLEFLPTPAQFQHVLNMLNFALRVVTKFEIFQNFIILAAPLRQIEVQLSGFGTQRAVFFDHVRRKKERFALFLLPYGGQDFLFRWSS